MGRPVRPKKPDQPSFGAFAESAALGMAFQLLAAPERALRRFVHVSESCLQLNGVPAAAAIADAKALIRLIVPEDRKRLSDAVTTRAAFDIEVRFRTPQGETRWSRLAAAPRATPWPDGSILWDGIQIDVTEKRRIQQELAEQRRRLDLATEATGLGFWEWDLRARSLTWSDRNRALFGYAADDDVTVEQFSAAVHPDDLAMVGQVFRDNRDTPDHEFSVEYRVIMPSGAHRWILAHARTIHDGQGPAMIVGTSLDVTERRTEEERRALLVSELAHRSKNGLTMVMAIASQTARGAASVEHYEERLMSRLQALAQSQDMVTESGGRPVRLGELMAKVLEPFDLSRMSLDAGLNDVWLNGETGFAVALLSHELATNATKYGALSTAEGRIEVRLTRTAEGFATVEWRERGGPPAIKTSRKGFGSRLMQMAMRPRGGKVTPVFETEGLTVILDIPTEVSGL